MTSLTSDAAKGSFGNVEVLKAQVKAAATSEAANAGTGTGQIAFMNADNVATAASNLAPTAVSLSVSSISEAADSLVVGTVSTTDADQASDTPFKYSIAQVAGEDFAKFSINESTGVLTILEQPDFETKASYKVSVKSEDSGGKSLVEGITVSIVDANDPPTLDGVTGLASVEDAADATGTFTAVDSNSDTLTYLIPGQSAAAGVFTVVGTYGTLTLTEATGAYTYALNNSNSTVNALLEYAVTSQVEKITGPTAPTIVAGDKFKVSVNSIDIETAGAAGTEVGLAGIVSMLNTANAAPLVAGTFEVSGADITFTYTATGTQAGTISKLFFMDESAGTSYDSGSGTGAALTAGATNFLTESFDIQVHDTNYYVTKAVSFNIQGKNDIASLSIPTDGLVTEVTDDSVVTSSGVITAADLDSDTPTVTLTGVSTVIDVAGTDTYQKVGTYGTLVLNKDPNSSTFTHQYTYTLNNSDVDTLGLSGADLVTESFGITVTDEDGGVGTSTLDIKVQGYGVTMDSVAGNEKINAGGSD